MESKKEIFKVLIKEFHGGTPPRVIKRDLRLPGWCLETAQDRGSVPLPAQAVNITGPRWAGKTYYLYQLMENLGIRSESPIPRTRVLYINFADDRLLPLEASELSLLLDAYFELYPDNREQCVAIFLDEIHNVEGWDLFVRRLLDKQNFRVFITGSSSKPYTQSLAGYIPGRALSFQLLPLSFGEYLAFRGVVLADDSTTSSERYNIRYLLDEYLIYGGYPEVVLSELSAKLRIIKDYYDILVYKDMVECFAIRNVGLLKGLLKHLVTHMGSAVSLNAYYLGLLPKGRVSRETIMEYVSYLEQKDIISLVPLFSDSEKARQVNPRRVFCVDNGLRNAVSFQLAEDEERLAKNVVFQKLKRTGEQVYYWKDKGEVDFVTRGDGKFCGITVSYGRKLDPSATKPLLELKRAAGKRDTDLTVITKDTEKAEAGVKYIPLWKWLLAGQ
jgi:predicted AAA+ superfamily ATPase